MAEAEAAAPAPAAELPGDREPDPSAAPEKKDAPAGKTYTQEEMDRILAKVRKNARYLGRKEAESELLKQGVGPRQAAAEAERVSKKPEGGEEPKRDDYPDYESYQRAIAGYEARKASREVIEQREKEEKDRRHRETLESAERTWHGKIEAAMKALPDFEEVLEDRSDVLGMIHGTPMRGFITESEIGPQIVYHLCKNEAEAKRIAALPAYKQAAEIAKIEEQLAATKADPGKKEDPKDDTDPKSERNLDGTFKPKKEPSKAPEPIDPVGARSANVSADPSDRDDDATWLKKRIAQEEARRARRK